MKDEIKKEYHYLALGDSYTIGERVNPDENFPNQVFSILKNDFPGLLSPRIIAKTGWTTDELEDGIIKSDVEDPLLPSYDMVSLLIGVNNQYRGRPLNEYKGQFEALLKKAIQFAGNRADRVIVLSIPDWGITPFAEARLPDGQGRDRDQIAKEIDAYNDANKKVADLYNIYYISITPWTREAESDPSLLADDGLHPSGKEYKRWAEKIAEWFKTNLG